MEIMRELSEHFDSLQLLGTFIDDEGNTGKVSMGSGNWYARIGVAREFIEQDAAATNAYELSKVICDEGEEEDDD